LSDLVIEPLKDEIRNWKLEDRKTKNRMPECDRPIFEFRFSSVQPVNHPMT